MKIISFCSEKGGVGKTTTTVNMGVQLSQMDNRVLIVDLDGQGNASRFLGFIRDGKPTSAELIYNAVAEMQTDMNEVIRHSQNFEHLDYIPSNQMLTGITNFMANHADSNHILRNLFRSDYFVQNYDYILFDCRTLLDLLVSNALNASDYVIIPVESGVYSFDGLSKMLDKVDSIHDSTNADLELLGIVLNKQNRTIVGTSVADSIRDKYQKQVFINSVPYLPAQCEGNVLGVYKDNTLNTAFKNLASELVYRIKKPSMELPFGG